MKFLAGEKTSLSGQSGFTMLQLLIALAFIGMAISAFWQSRVNSLRIEKNLRASQKFLDIEQIFHAEIKSILSELNPNNCLTNGIIANRPLISGYSNANFQFKTNIRKTLEDLQASGSIPAKISNDFMLTNANNRCSKPQFIQTNQVTNNDMNKLYFCIEFTRDDEAPSDSFLGAHHAFAEIAIHLKNFHDNSKMSCRNFVNLDSGGAEVYYSLYWTTISFDQVDYRRRNGVLYATK